MPADAIIGLAIFAAAMLGHIALQRLLLEWAQPKRERMFALADELLTRPRMTAPHRRLIGNILVSSWSGRVGVLMPIALLAALMDELLGRRFEADFRGSADEERLRELVRLYRLSVIAANPIVSLICAPLYGAVVLLAMVMRKSAADAVEEPFIVMANAERPRTA